jgi:hypothetical protein
MGTKDKIRRVSAIEFSGYLAFRFSSWEDTDGAPREEMGRVDG